MTTFDSISGTGFWNPNHSPFRADTLIWDFFIVTLPKLLFYIYICFFFTLRDNNLQSWHIGTIYVLFLVILSGIFTGKDNVAVTYLGFKAIIYRSLTSEPYLFLTSPPHIKSHFSGFSGNLIIFIIVFNNTCY